MNNWKMDKPTNRQIKVLKFFACFKSSMTKGQASTEIIKLFKDKKFREHWDRYLFLTEDFGNEDSDLKDYDYKSLKSITIPEGWKPKHKLKKLQKKTMPKDILTNILEEGIPFDNPVPLIVFNKKEFCLTGKFTLGSRKLCEKEITKRGGVCSKNPSSSTHYLVIGGGDGSSWSNGTFGRKILLGLKYKLEGSNLHIITEQSWYKNCHRL